MCFSTPPSHTKLDVLMVIFDTFLQHRKTFQKRPVFYHFSKRKLSRLSSRVVAILSMAKMVDPFEHIMRHNRIISLHWKSARVEFCWVIFQAIISCHFSFIAWTNSLHFLASEVKLEAHGGHRGRSCHFVHYVHFFTDFNACFFRS